MIEELDALRRQAKEAAQAEYIAALIAGDVQRATGLFPAAQHGTLEADRLDEFGLTEAYEQITQQPEEAP